MLGPLSTSTVAQSAQCPARTPLTSYKSRTKRFFPSPW